MAKADQKVGVSERAVIARLNRKLAEDEETLRKTREGTRSRSELGEFYRLDLSRNVILGKGIDLDEMAREYGVLRAWEVLIPGE